MKTKQKTNRLEIGTPVHFVFGDYCNHSGVILNSWQKEGSIQYRVYVDLLNIPPVKCMDYELSTFTRRNNHQ